MFNHESNKTNSYLETSMRAAEILAEQIRNKPDSVLGLATGSSPVGMYKELIKMNQEGTLDFSKISSINLDEYYGLASDNDQSYRYFMNTNLFDHVNIRKECTFVPDGLTKDPEAECAAYDRRIEEMGGIDTCWAGIGAKGLVAFCEAPHSRYYRISQEQFKNSKTRIVELNEDTLVALSQRSLSAYYDMIPPKAVTLGMKAILS